MTIEFTKGKAVTEVPKGTRGRSSKYREFVDQAKAIDKGKIVPFEFADQDLAERARTALVNQDYPKKKVKRRGNTVYVEGV